MIYNICYNAVILLQGKDKKVKLKRINIIVVALSMICLVGYIFIVEDYHNIIRIFHSVSPIWIIFAVFFMIAYWFIESIILHVPMKKLYPSQKYVESLKTSMIGQFYNSITPSASGGQPMQALYMVRTGVPLGVGTSALVIKLITYQIIIAAYLVVMSIFKLKSFSSSIPGLAYPIVIGLVVNIIVTSAFILFCCFKNFAIGAARKIIGLLCKTRLLRHADEKLEYIEEEIGKFYDSFHIIRQHPFMMAEMCLLAAVQLTLYFIIPYFIYRSFGLNNASIYSFIASQAFVLNISYFVPLPGAAGGAEVSFYAFYQLFFPWSVLNLAILLWRLITYYSNIVVGGFFALAINKTSKKTCSHHDAAC